MRHRRRFPHRWLAVCTHTMTLWKMRHRRFNKQIYYVKAAPSVPPGGLDLSVVKQDEFSPDKLRSNIERLYMTAIVGMAG
jgi:hypothetical protein